MSNELKTPTRVEELIAEHEELNKLIPLDQPKPKPRVAKSELWSRSERQELSRLAEQFLKAKKGEEQ